MHIVVIFRSKFLSRNLGLIPDGCCSCPCQFSPSGLALLFLSKPWLKLKLVVFGHYLREIFGQQMPGNYDTGFGANNRHRLREHVASRNFIGEPNVCCEAFNSLDRQMSAHGLNWVINGRPRPLRYEAPLMPTWSQNWDVEANERGVATHLVNVALVGTENYGAQPPMDSAPATLIVEEYLDNLQFNQVMDDSADLGNSDDATAGPDSSDDDFRDSSTPDVTTEEESLDYSSSDGSSVGAVEMTPAQMMKLVIMPLGEAARNEIAAETPSRRALLLN